MPTQVSFKKWDSDDPILAGIVKEEQAHMDVIDNIIKVPNLLIKRDLIHRFRNIKNQIT